MKCMNSLPFGAALWWICQPRAAAGHGSRRLEAAKGARDPLPLRVLPVGTLPVPGGGQGGAEGRRLSRGGGRGDRGGGAGGPRRGRRRGLGGGGEDGGG
jgi:hypothetical protein